jgi:tRNA U34 5-methylaminomethyl-2-thiouridine-forming methyltransferase MnmC
MERKMIITEDGSSSISIPKMNVTYHSVHGAIQESKHVFIEAGLNGSDRLKRSDPLYIFEMGFGTGLNALLTLVESEKWNRRIYYETIEPFPLDKEPIKSLNFCQQLQRNDLQSLFEKMHSCAWENKIPVTENFILKKLKTNLLNYETEKNFDLIYFDAFDPNVQPELWTKEVFEKMFSMLNPESVLVTYSSKGSVRRAMQTAGFIVEKLPGPPGKREIIRANKR